MINKYFLCVLLLSAFFSCEDKSQSTSEEIKIDESIKTLNTVKSELLPPILYDEAITSKANLLEGDPCSELTGSDKMEVFLKCQPILLKIYLSLSKLYIDEIALILNEDKVLIEKNIDQETFVLKDDDIPYMSGRITEKSFQFILSASEFEEDNNSQTTNGNFQLDIKFIGENDWDLTAFMGEIPCHPESLNDPERFKLIISKRGDIRTGKMMTYHAQSGQDCEAPITDESSMNIYTDFVASTGEAKVNIYLLGRQISDLSRLSKYEIGLVCINFPQYCNGNSTNSTSTITNPMCLTKENVTAQWGKSCLEDLSKIKILDFGADNLWTIPRDFYKENAPSFSTNLE